MTDCPQGGDFSYYEHILLDSFNTCLSVPRTEAREGVQQTSQKIISNNNYIT